MTAQQCLPPEGAEDGSYHWLQDPGIDDSLIAEWAGGRWYFLGLQTPQTAEETALEGWRYDRPVPPRDADAERAAKNAEIARLREALDAESKRVAEACMTIVYEEGRGRSHGAGAWKVVQAALRMEKRIESLPAPDRQARVALKESEPFTRPTDPSPENWP